VGKLRVGKERIRNEVSGDLVPGLNTKRTMQKESRWLGLKKNEGMPSLEL
jgi:hypothetical protein